MSTYTVKYTDGADLDRAFAAIQTDINGVLGVLDEITDVLCDEHWIACIDTAKLCLERAKEHLAKVSS